MIQLDFKFKNQFSRFWTSESELQIAEELRKLPHEAPPLREYPFEIQTSNFELQKVLNDFLASKITWNFQVGSSSFNELH